MRLVFLHESWDWDLGWGRWGRRTVVDVRVPVTAKSLPLGRELKGLCAGCVDLVFVVACLVIAVAAGRLVVWISEVSLGFLSRLSKGSAYR